MTDLYAAAALVRDGPGLSAFARALLAEVHENARDGRPFASENFDLGSCLESIAEWSETELADRELAGANPFAAAARVLLVGHYHE